MDVSPLPKILISSAEVIPQKPAGERGPPLSFEKGHVLSARVLEIPNPRQAVLLIQGQKVMAKIFVPLRPGQEIRLSVTETHPQPVLRWVGEVFRPESEGIRHLIRSYGTSGPFAHLANALLKADAALVGTELPSFAAAFARLKALVNAIALKSGEAAPHFLKDLIDGSGLCWEKKIHSGINTHTGFPSDLAEKDLKAIVMRLLSLEGQAHQSERLGEFKSFLAGLEELQLFNKFGGESTGRFLLPLPVLMQEDLRFGQLLLQVGDGRQKTDNEENLVVKVSFLLTLTQLGELRADVAMRGQTLFGTIGVATEGIFTYITSHLGELTSRLEAHGYKVQEMHCRVETPEALAQTALIDRAVDGIDGGVLDLII